MKAIYASKIYKASKRKDKIVAAMQNPINAELVSQLAEYLDEEYQQPDPSTSSEEKSNESHEESAEAFTGDSSSFGGHAAFPSGMSDFELGGDAELDEYTSESGEELSDDSIEDIDLDSAEVDTAEDSDIDVVDDIEVDSDSEAIEEATEVLGHDDSIEVDGDVVDQIKGLLNAREDTAGINRALVKENELWIYYEDNINLNNVMVNVIEVLNASGYTYLEFNRLARSANAIVFQISSNDTINTVKPIQEGEADETK